MRIVWGASELWKTNVTDFVPPVLTLIGGDVELIAGRPYYEQGFTATDNIDGDITYKVWFTLPRLDTAGEKTISYFVFDTAGNTVEEIRSITITAGSGFQALPTFDFDGFGYVITDRKELAGDFSVTIPRFVHNNITETILRNRSDDRNMLLTGAGNQIIVRIDSADIVLTLAELGPGNTVSDLIISRVSGTVTVSAMLQSVTGATSATWILDTIGGEGGSPINYSGEMYAGNLIINNAGTVDSYNFRLADLDPELVTNNATPSNPGVLRNFRTGGFINQNTQIVLPASAGPDQTVFSGELVTLDGSQGSEPETVFSWEAPPGVVLSDFSVSGPTFTAPEARSLRTYTFVLTVITNGITAQDSVNIFVKAAPFTSAILFSARGIRLR